MNIIIEKLFKDKLYFKIAYLITSLIFITFIGEYKIISSITSKIMIAWSVIIILNIFIKNKFKYSTKAPYIFIFFIILRIISIYMTGINKEALVEIFVDLTMFIAIFDVNIKVEVTEFSLNKFVLISDLILSILSLTSFLFYILKKNIAIKGVMYGYINERSFVGIFSNENSLGISAVICLILSLYLMMKLKNKFITFIGLINILIQIFIIANCNATNSILILLVFVWCFILLIFRHKLFRLFYILLSFGGVTGIIYKLVMDNKIEKLLNGRYNLWITATKVIKENLIFGVGQNKFLHKMNEYAVGALEGITGGGTHNLFIQISIISGVVVLIGFVITMLYFFITIITKNDLIRNNTKRIENIIIISLLLAILASNCFETNLIYIISFISIIFWALLGYIYNSLEYK